MIAKRKIEPQLMKLGLSWEEGLEVLTLLDGFDPKGNISRVLAGLSASTPPQNPNAPYGSANASLLLRLVREKLRC